MHAPALQQSMRVCRMDSGSTPTGTHAAHLPHACAPCNTPAPCPPCAAQAPTTPDGKLEQLRVHLVLAYPGDFAPLSGEPAEAAYAGGSMQLPVSFSKPFRQEASREGLLKLINGTAQLSLHDSGSGAQLATATIDMLPLALGSSFSLQDVQLTPCASTGSSPIKVGSLSSFKPLIQEGRE